MNDLKAGCNPDCPACAHRGMRAADSLMRKEAGLARQLAPWRAALTPIQAPRGRWGYRDHVCLSAAWAEGGWQFGMVSRKELVPIPHCPIHTERVRQVVALLTKVLPPGPAFPLVYFLQSGVQATLVVKTRRMPEMGWFGEGVEAELSRIGIEGIWLHLHPSAGRRVTAKPGWHLVWGRPRSTLGNGLIYGPTSFQQPIPALYERALNQAEAFLRPTGGSLVVDLYCGIGATLRRWAGSDARCAGVELNGEAVECAGVNAPGVILLRGRCRDRIPQLNAWLDQHKRRHIEPLLYLNPPRTGVEPEVVGWIGQKYRPVRAAYLSCSAGTLRRDLTELKRWGYQVVCITPFDFFPQTRHVESLVLLARREAH